MPMPSTRAQADPMVHNQFYNEYNRMTSFEICSYGQELVQDLIQRCAELSVTLRQFSSYLLITDQHQFSQRKSKIDEFLKGFEGNLTRLRVFAVIINERKQALDRQQQQQQQLDENAQAEKSDELKRLQKEREELIEAVKTKNSFVKYAEEKIANIIWQINAIQNLKH